MPEHGPLIAVVSREDVRRLEPWLAAHARQRDVQVMHAWPSAWPRAEAVFAVGPRPTGLFIEGPSHRMVLGGVTRLSDAWIAAATEVARREGEPSHVVLAQGSTRALALSRELEAPLRAIGWQADRLAYFRLAESLSQGFGAVWYTGQGSAEGWLGYQGVRAPALQASSPCGAVFSITCATGQPNGFCEQLTEKGFAAATLGAVTRTNHQRNRAFALALATAGAVTVADAVRAAAHLRLSAASYRIHGDPLARLTA